MSIKEKADITTRVDIDLNIIKSTANLKIKRKTRKTHHTDTICKSYKVRGSLAVQ